MYKSWWLLHISRMSPCRRINLGDCNISLGCFHVNERNLATVSCLQMSVCKCRSSEIIYHLQVMWQENSHSDTCLWWLLLIRLYINSWPVIQSGQQCFPALGSWQVKKDAWSWWTLTSRLWRLIQLDKQCEAQEWLLGRSLPQVEDQLCVNLEAAVIWTISFLSVSIVTAAAS